MGYLRWALLALVAYTLVAPLTKVATREIPSDVVVIVANGMLVVAAVGIVALSDVSVVPYLTHRLAPYAYASGIALTVGIIAYYRALAAGPVSVVTPIFGLFIVSSSLVGVVALDESLTLTKAAGVGFAVLAIVLTAR
jgi:transporter family protein